MSLDSTADRFQQDAFPDLDLIRERGLIEPDAQQTDQGRSDCDFRTSGVAKKLPSFQDTMDLAAPWLDVLSAAERDPSLTPLQDTMWECMTKRSKLKIGKDVPLDYLQAVNREFSRGDVRKKLGPLSTVYADCSEAYFDRLGTLLEQQRPALVERNRELLQRYAAELIATGYVP